MRSSHKAEEEHPVGVPQVVPPPSHQIVADPIQLLASCSSELPCPSGSWSRQPPQWCPDQWSCSCRGTWFPFYVLHAVDDWVPRANLRWSSCLVKSVDCPTYLAMPPWPVDEACSWLSRVQNSPPYILHDCLDVGFIVQDHVLVSAKLIRCHSFANALMFKKVRLIPLFNDLVLQPHLGVLGGHSELVHVHARQSLHLAQSILLVLESLLEILDRLILLPHVTCVFGNLGLHVYKLLILCLHGVLCIHLEVLTVRCYHLCIGCQSHWYSFHLLSIQFLSFGYIVETLLLKPLQLYPKLFCCLLCIMVLCLNVLDGILKLWVVSPPCLFIFSNDVSCSIFSKLIATTKLKNPHRRALVHEMCLS